MAEELIKLGGYVVQGHGSDETVLWEGESKENISLSESLANFEKVIFVVSTSKKSSVNYYVNIHHVTFDTSDVLNYPTLLTAMAKNGVSSANTLLIQHVTISCDGDNITVSNECQFYWNSSGTLSITQTGPYIRKVIGINRKEGV